MATWYVGPQTGGGSPAGAGTEADPWNGIGNVVFGTSGVNSGDTLAFAGGDYTGEGTFEVTVTYTAPTHFVAVGRALLDRFIANGKQNVVVRGVFEVADTLTSSSISLWSNSGRNNDGCRVDGFRSLRSTGSGISINRSTSIDPTPAEYVEVVNAYAEDDGQHGIILGGALNGGRVANSIATGSSSTASGWGVYAAGYHTKWTDTGWTLLGGFKYRRSVAVSGLQVKRVIAPGRTAAPYWLTEGVFGSTIPGEWAQSGDNLEINIGEDPNSKSVIAVYQECKNIVFEDNVTFAMDAAFDGVGTGGDHTVENLRIRRAMSYANPGRGVSLNVQINGEVLGCSVPNNTLSGVGVSTPYGTNAVRQVSSYGTGDQQFLAQRVESGATVLFENCIGQGGDNVFEGLAIAGTVTDRYNCAFGGSLANYSGITKGAGSVEVDPKFRNPTGHDLRLDGDSPCIGAGINWWGGLSEPCPQGEDGLRFMDPPSMGAYEVRPDKSTYARACGALPSRVLPGGVDVCKARAA